MKRTLLAAVALLALLAAGGYAVYGQTEPGASAPDRQRLAPVQEPAPEYGAIAC